MSFLEKNYEKRQKNSNFETFENALYMKSGSIPLISQLSVSFSQALKVQSGQIAESGSHVWLPDVAVLTTILYGCKVFLIWI